MTFIPLQKILPRSIAALGLTRQARAALICEKYRKLAPRIIHAEALKHTLPKFYKRKTLTVGVENPAWAEYIKNRKKDLIEEINGSLGEKAVSEIKTQIY